MPEAYRSYSRNSWNGSVADLKSLLVICFWYEVNLNGCLLLAVLQMKVPVHVLPPKNERNENNEYAAATKKVTKGYDLFNMQSCH